MRPDREPQQGECGDDTEANRIGLDPGLRKCAEAQDREGAVGKMHGGRTEAGCEAGGRFASLMLLGLGTTMLIRIAQRML